MLKPILSEKDTYYNFLANSTRGTTWEEVNYLWFRVYTLQTSLEELESYLPDLEVNYTGLDGIEKRGVERMFQLLTDQIVDCNWALARLDSIQHIGNLQDLNSGSTATGTFGVVYRLGIIKEETYKGFANGTEAFTDLVSVRNWIVHQQWKKPNDVMVYQSVRRMIRTGRRYIKDVIRFLKASSLRRFFENCPDEKQQ